MLFQGSPCFGVKCTNNFSCLANTFFFCHCNVHKGPRGPTRKPALFWPGVGSWQEASQSRWCLERNVSHFLVACEALKTRNQVSLVNSVLNRVGIGFPGVPLSLEALLYPGYTLICMYNAGITSPQVLLPNVHVFWPMSRLHFFFNWHVFGQSSQNIHHFAIVPCHSILSCTDMIHSLILPVAFLWPLSLQTVYGEYQEKILVEMGSQPNVVERELDYHLESWICSWPGRDLWPWMLF